MAAGASWSPDSWGGSCSTSRDANMAVRCTTSTPDTAGRPIAWRCHGATKEEGQDTFGSRACWFYLSICLSVSAVSFFLLIVFIIPFSSPLIVSSSLPCFLLPLSSPLILPSCLLSPYLSFLSPLPLFVLPLPTYLSLVFDHTKHAMNPAR